MAIFICLFLAASCEIDNYEAPDATVRGAFFDHNGQPLTVEEGSAYLRMRENSWADRDTNAYVGYRTLALRQDGTYQHTRQFSGTYRMFPSSGNFFPYWEAGDEVKDGEEAGILVNVSGVTVQDFTVTPYLTIEWVKKPYYVASGNYIECVVRFTRNQKPGFNMPDVQFANMRIGRSEYPTRSRIAEYEPAQLTLTNDMEGTDITISTNRNLPIKVKGVNYYIQITMNCKTAAGDNTTNYPGIGAWNTTTVESVFVP
jgi:hypothetical protein